MRKTLENYRNIIGDEAVDSIYAAAAPLSEKHVVHINSAYYGGGVAAMLNSLVFLMNDVGIYTGWRLMKGSDDFFDVTKSFHNSLQGENILLSKFKKRVYLENNESFSRFNHLNHDCVIVHDPQPLAMINFYKKKQPWIWRCHIDLSNPNRELWDYLNQFIVKYDGVIVSSNKFRQNLPNPQHIIHPSIDPLDDKNKDLSDHKVNLILKKNGIDVGGKPIISQISRFDKWKDPIGVMKAFKIVRKKVDCRLVLLGSGAMDDPEGAMMHEKAVRYAAENPDITLIMKKSEKLVNALQRASAVVLQKSLKEGFGLTVSEAMWKEKPVVAANVGGIPLQIKDGESGFLINNIKECADRTIRLLENEKLAQEIGRNAKERVREKFLITRHLMDYIDLLKITFKKDRYQKILRKFKVKWLGFG